MNANHTDTYGKGQRLHPLVASTYWMRRGNAWKYFSLLLIFVLCKYVDKRIKNRWNYLFANDTDEVMKITHTHTHII